MEGQRIGTSARHSGYHKQLLHAIGQHLPQRGLPLSSGDGRLRWTDRLLAMTAILMSWTPGDTLGQAFESAREVVVSMYASRRRPGRSFAGFVTALEKASGELVDRVVPSLRQSLRRCAGPQWRWKGWAVMAVDGSRINCPRTAANEEAFGCAGRDKTTPQQFLTTIFHMPTGLIWSWRKGRGDASERGHLEEMLKELPRRSLLLMDAGYVGHALGESIGRAGHDWIVRVGSNVTLLRKLGYFVRERADIVYLWPQGRRRQEPLVLRKVEVRGGRQRVCLLTNVLSGRRLSDAQVAAWYRQRWLVEVRYRGLKQTLAKRKMLSDAPHKAQVELDWAVVGLALLGLMAAGQVPANSRWSVALALNAVRRAMRSRRRRPRQDALQVQLRAAVIDGYVRRRSKQARDWPHKKHDPPCGCPIIRMARRSEVRLAKELLQCKTAS